MFPHSYRARSSRLLAASVVASLGSHSLAIAQSTNQQHQQPVMSLTELTLISRYGAIRIDPGIAASQFVTPSVVNAPPINGFVPQVLFGLTSEQDKNGTLNFQGKASTTPAGLIASWTLPKDNTPYYDVAIFDTGSQAHLITNRNAGSLGFDLEGSGRLGAYQQPIEGVNGQENTDISDALGIYATGFSNGSVNGSGKVNITPGTLKGQWNVPILSTAEDSALPNLIGSPMASEYQTVISNSQTRHLNVGTTTYRTPNITFQPLNTAAPPTWSKLTLGVQSANGVTPDPAYFPSIDNFENFADDPSTPGFWANFTATATAAHTGGSSGGQDFLFDTGADVSVVSEDTAAQVGFFTGGENPTPFDFHVDVTGVGGGTVSVGGFYMNSLSVTTNGGPITWTHVPVLVLNIPDPRDGVGFIPGVLGMNLFTDRDLIINGGTSNPFLAIGPQITPQWTATGGGTWSDDSKWSLGSPDGDDRQANFLSSITADSTITVDSVGFTVGSMKFDNAHRYTIAGPGTIKMLAQSTGSAAITVVSGSHTISAPVTLASNAAIDVQPAASVLTMSGDFDGGTFSLGKNGAGTVVMKSLSGGSVSINQGTIAIAQNGTAASVSKVGTLAIAGGSTPTATLDLSDNDLILSGNSYSDAATAIAYARNGGAWNRPGITSSAARDALPAIKTLGAVTGSQYIPTSFLGAVFDGVPISNSSILVKYTYYGDTDLNGKIDGSDYSRIDTNFNREHTAGNVGGWFNGDFDYNGKIDGGDYAAIDAAFNAQNGTLKSAATFLVEFMNSPQTSTADPGLLVIADHFREFGQSYANAFLTSVPEPASMSVISITGIWALCSRRRRRDDCH